MDHWEAIRRQARAQHRIVCKAAYGETSVQALLEAAACLTQIQAVALPAGDSLLDGGEAVLDREVGIIWFNQDIEPALAHFYITHEYAHFWLDGSIAVCTRSDVDAESSEEPLSPGVQRVEGYGPQERREREANIFAREFLLPMDRLQQWYVVDGLDATEIAARTGTPEGMVFHQLAQALLTPLIKDEELEQEGVPEPVLLDPSQQAAVYAKHGPILVEAGPGTGKTRALVSRVVFLLQQGVEPSSILALTFSNKAAEEMRARLSLVSPESARKIWIGTFHAFSLELLRKFGTWLGFPARISVIDPVDALFLLEGMLPELQLDYYQNLYEPTTFLRDLLAAISRAKDELVGSGEYAVLADQMRMSAQTDKEQEAAAKVLEVARVYRFYQEALHQKHLLDFGDLIFQAVTLLRSHPDIRMSLQSTYTHILVDEYQDVNWASGRLLQELAGMGSGLWVVGDIRQAIYRFRGAAPSNMRLFTEDFPGTKKLSLRQNYRSQPAIVEVFTTLAPQMRVAQKGGFTPWESQRSDTGGRVLLEIVEDMEVEGVSLAREMARQQAAGIAYRDQAVLCRSHATLARIAPLLEREGIPVLYLGNLFERPEVRDLLAMVSLTCEVDGRGLIRVARFAEYNIPLADVKALLAAARLHKKPFPGALSLALQVENISPQGRRGLALLIGHLDGLCYGTSVWQLLVNYLFVRSAYLRSVLGDESVSGSQRRLALFQFLQFAHEQGKTMVENTGDSKLAFLRYVRRLEIFGEDKPLRQIPEWAANLDAVRLLTMHSSKGLEFPVVYLPGLNQGYFPARRRWQPCPPPVGMMVRGEQDEHEEEEESLFFVALSRAQDILYLSYARRIGNRKSQPSPLLALVERHLVGNTIDLREDRNTLVEVPVGVKSPPWMFPQCLMSRSLTYI